MNQTPPSFPWDKTCQAFKAMAHPTRLQILVILSQAERAVGELGEMLPISQANLSQHLQLLKDKGLLSCRRQGKQVLYRLRDNRLLGLLALARDLFA